VSGGIGLKVLVTDGNSRAALAVTRSLGRLGHSVFVGEKPCWALAQASRFCAGSIVYPDPATDEKAFIEALVRSVRENQIDVILPVADITTMLVTSSRGLFEPACQIPFAEAECVLRAADKAHVIRSAERLGIPVPRTVFLESRDEVQASLSQLSFPVVVKARASRLRTGQGWISSGVRYVQNEIELAAEVARRHQAEFPLLVQERIYGPGIGVFACYDRGEALAFFGHRRLREKPPSGGVSVLSESVDLSPATRAYTEALLRDLNWRGVAMVEFKVDDRDGTPRLMEINGRFWGSLQLAIDAGVDFPAILLTTLNGAERRPMPHYRRGVKSRWLLGDLDSLAVQLFGKSQVAHGTGRSQSRRARLRALYQFMTLWERDLHYENPWLSDLGPWFSEAVHWIGRSWSRTNG
jgi:predicted ATP-grasp superfamily ATP-dependent carboligase